MTKTETYIERARRELQEPCDKSELTDISKVKIDPDADPEERIRQLVKQLRNPYRFIANGITVKTEFVGECTLKECLDHFLASYDPLDSMREIGELADARGVTDIPKRTVGKRRSA